MSILQDISTNLQIGKAKIVKTLVQQALDEGISAQDILSQGLLDGMNKVGEQFKNNEIFVPEVLIAARAMSMGTAVLKPYLASEGVQSRGKIVIGTVRGDLHDIGKNLVKMMIEGKGIEVIDLGTDVPAEKFVQTAIENQCQVICLSALLTTTMGVMADVVSEAEKAGIRDKVKIMMPTPTRPMPPARRTRWRNTAPTRAKRADIFPQFFAIVLSFAPKKRYNTANPLGRRKNYGR